MGVRWGQIVILYCDGDAYHTNYVSWARLGFSLEEVGISWRDGEG
jgi:hypothetical protein